MREQLSAFGDWLKNSLTIACDLMILNLLFILCSIPVITLGAAGVACYSSMIRIMRGERVGMSIAGFFREFAANFKMATLGWLIELVCLLILAGDIWFAVVYSKPVNTFFLIFAIVLAAAVLFAGVWFYPLVARFENSLGTHIKNSFKMVLARFPKSLLAVLIQAAFIGIPFIMFDVFIYFGWIWILVGASLPMYLIVWIFRKTLQCEQKKPDENLIKHAKP